MLAGESTSEAIDSEVAVAHLSTERSRNQVRLVSTSPTSAVAAGPHNAPSLSVLPQPKSRYYIKQKRVFDLSVTALLVFSLLPIIATVAALVRCTSRGPIIYRQKRLTAGGRIFTMYKFRTMRLDAENGTGAVWASSGDSRVTAIGAILRRTRLDELPQLWNVIQGDMSLIGPRPERPEFAHELSELLPNFPQRLLVPAGITGLAQVSSGYAACVESYRQKLAYDLQYVAERSIWLDLKIAVKTVLVIITGTGAR